LAWDINLQAGFRGLARARREQRTVRRREEIVGHAPDMGAQALLRILRTPSPVGCEQLPSLGSHQQARLGGARPCAGSNPTAYECSLVERYAATSVGGACLWPSRWSAYWCGGDTCHAWADEYAPKDGDRIIILVCVCTRAVRPPPEMPGIPSRHTP